MAFRFTVVYLKRYRKTNSPIGNQKKKNQQKKKKTRFNNHNSPLIAQTDSLIVLVLANYHTTDLAGDLSCV